MSEPHRTSSTAQRRAPWVACLLICGTVLGLLAATQLWIRFTEPGPDLTLETALLDPDLDLTSISPVLPMEAVVLAVLLGIRLTLLALKTRPVLEPLVDLPLLGLAIAVTGGGFSPLDPALPLAYLAAVIFLRGEEVGRRSRHRVAGSIVLGLLAIHLLVTYHDHRRLVQSEQAQSRTTEQIIGEFAAPIEGVRALLDQIEKQELQAALIAAGADDAPATPLSDSEAGLYRAIVKPLGESQEALDGFLRDLSACVTLTELDHLRDAISSEVTQHLHEEWPDARDRWRSSPFAGNRSAELSSLENIRDSQVNILHAAEVALGDLQVSLATVNRTRSRLQNLQKNSTQRRTFIAVAIALFAILAIALRDHLRDAVRRAQEARSRRDIELREREKDNWIALTAGLTHGLGNDILAYDIYLGEILAELAEQTPRPSGKLVERLQFLHDSNKGRLAFLQFLEAFARQRKAADNGDSEDLPLNRVELVPLLHTARRHLAAVETADLPPEGSDPAVDRQLRRLRDLPLEVDCTEAEAGVLHQGNKGVVEFFAFELLKNALRSATGERPIRVRLKRQASNVVVTMVNDVRIHRSRGHCPSCNASDVELRAVHRRRDQPPACSRCFADRLQSILTGSFEPGRGGGTGLGLFLIRYFLSTYYRGEIRAGVLDADIPEVFFRLTIPDRAPTTTRSDA